MGKTWHPACLTCALCRAQLQVRVHAAKHKHRQHKYTHTHTYTLTHTHTHSLSLSLSLSHSHTHSLSLCTGAFLPPRQQARRPLLLLLHQRRATTAVHASKISGSELRRSRWGRQCWWGCSNLWVSMMVSGCLRMHKCPVHRPEPPPYAPAITAVHRPYAIQEISATVPLITLISIPRSQGCR